MDFEQQWLKTATGLLAKSGLPPVFIKFYSNIATLVHLDSAYVYFCDP